ncbi:MAG: cation transporter [Spirochaetales bacterium]|nr:cation transporter [Spirochaetales bacterium]
MIKIRVGIDGMACGMCEAHICDVIRKTVPAARKVKASRRRKEATFVTDDAVNESDLKSAINATGYTFISMSVE